MTRRWLAVASALMLAWTFFLGAALATRNGSSTTSSHICACAMCKDGIQKSCCCSGGTGHSLRASCDLTDAANLLLVSIPASLPLIFTAPQPLLDTSEPAIPLTPGAGIAAGVPTPPYTPPRFLS